jgi:hypothetical protein
MGPSYLLVPPAPPGRPLNILFNNTPYFLGPGNPLLGLIPPALPKGQHNNPLILINNPQRLLIPVQIRSIHQQNPLLMDLRRHKLIQRRYFVKVDVAVVGCCVGPQRTELLVELGSRN